MPAARQHLPDVVLLDVRMPVLDGVEATRRIATDPALHGVRVVVLTNYGLDEYAFDALVNRAMTKLHARDRAQLVIIAYESGLVTPHSL